MATVLDFEAPIAEIESQLDELRNVPGLTNDQLTKEVASLEASSQR